MLSPAVFATAVAGEASDRLCAYAKDRTFK
jgi:hypothetical protein